MLKNFIVNDRQATQKLYSPEVKTPVVGASLFGDNLTGCHPNRLYLPPTAVLKNSVKTKLPLILLLVGLAGCQQKSEIDKCVEALVVQECMNSDDKKNCVNELKDVLGGLFRLECLKAKAGGK